MTNRGGSPIASAIIGLTLLGTAGSALARCGDDPADMDKVAEVRAQVAIDCDCDSATDHSSYVDCAKTTVSAALTSGQLPKTCKNTVLNAARKSTCGRVGAVTCCRTNRNHKTNCSVKTSPARCTAPSGGSACVGLFTSCSDSCGNGGCITFTPTPAPTPTPPSFCQPVVPAPGVIQVPLTLQAGTDNCGGGGLMPPAAAPYSGELDDASNTKLADLGLGCLYTGRLPGLKIPSGGTQKLAVSGIGIGTVTFAGGAGSGPSDCTQGALETKHCLNGDGGNDGTGVCVGDSDCGGAPGSCAMDARCFFGPPIPVVSISTICVVSAFQSDLCGSIDLTTNAATFSTVLASRVYGGACPTCVEGTCVGGRNDGATCAANATTGTSASCQPANGDWIASIPVIIPSLTTGASELSDPAGFLCPGQTSPGAFGVAAARRASETGSPASGSLDLNMKLGATFCVPSTGSFVVDVTAGLPAAGALSANGSVDLNNLLGLGL